MCLPNHRSMVDGHCLIVPMQHVTFGTQVDEDVWTEIQVSSTLFRLNPISTLEKGYCANQVTSFMGIAGQVQ